MRGLRTGLPSKALSLLTMPKQPRRARSSRAISTATQSSTRGRGRGRTTRARSRSTSPSGLTPPPPAVDTPSFDPELLSQMLGAIRAEVAAGFEAQRPPAPPQPLPPPVSATLGALPPASQLVSVPTLNSQLRPPAMTVPRTSGTSLAWANPLQHQSLDPSSQLQLLTTPPQTSQLELHWHGLTHYSTSLWIHHHSCSCSLPHHKPVNTDSSSPHHLRQYHRSWWTR